MHTQSIESARRIVTIAENLASPLSASNREKLVAEQRRLWDAEHQGRPFEAIQLDVWRFRSYG